MTGGSALTCAIIPARGGSKRIPRKNVRPFAGIPLLARTIATLVGSQLFDRVVVSTDDQEVANVAMGAGAEAPFVRPDDLADDFTGVRAVIRHAIHELEGDPDSKCGLVCMVYPAAVFVRPQDLRGARVQLVDSGADAVISATKFAHPIQRALKIRGDGFAEMTHPENQMVRTQDLEELFHDAGQFTWGTRRYWLTEGEGNSQLYVLPRWRVHDIDTEEDWERAELMWDALHRRPDLADRRRA